MAFFDRLPFRVGRRALERVYRSAFGLLPYYLVEIWWKKLYFPDQAHRPGQRAEFKWDSLLVTVFAALWIAALAGYPRLASQLADAKTPLALYVALGPWVVLGLGVASAGYAVGAFLLWRGIGWFAGEHTRIDVLVEVEDVGGVVAAFQFDESLVVVLVAGEDEVGAPLPEGPAQLRA